MEKSIQRKKRRRPPRRLAGCGHWIYAWRDRERCNACISADAEGELPLESWREVRRRLQEKGLL